ncbi:hypothetical protein B0O80DRAFT_436545 [Mortierella sp. GBAus27b]|nr:hypothetical protein B0O80DRAFT_436545 [Mortierella sp. GBAus27b]
MQPHSCAPVDPCMRDPHPCTSPSRCDQAFSMVSSHHSWSIISPTKTRATSSCPSRYAWRILLRKELLHVKAWKIIRGVSWAGACVLCHSGACPGLLCYPTL